MTIDDFSKCSSDNDYCIKYRYTQISYKKFRKICSIEDDFFLNYLIEHKIIDFKTHPLNDVKMIEIFFNFHSDINFENAFELNAQITIDMNSYDFSIKTIELNTLLRQLKQYI